jgi:hypothetical protein
MLDLHCPVGNLMNLAVALIGGTQDAMAPIAHIGFGKNA